MADQDSGIGLESSKEVSSSQDNGQSKVEGGIISCHIPKASDNLRQHTQEQLDANISDIMTEDPYRSYNHKEIAKITGSLSQTLIASLQEELTHAKQRINQLELKARDQQEGSDEVEPGAKEEIERLQETLTTTSRELEQAKAAQDDLVNKLQYAEQLLEKAKDLDKLARNINKFNPNLAGSQDVQAYLQDMDFHLEMRSNVTDRDRLYLLQTTSSPEMRSFLYRQPIHTKSDFHLLRESPI
ncbi:uncharacterized protein LOC113037733 [Carassius auratus]|uniref:Uncharacterized protein LOC113037733 n=1 Tax=Carassius auratus TaxID=7957 RepID=A0A6P6IT52_CARAU|nr:uncharacterized protein LOC113037733 [Carassius auratus]